MGGDSPAATAAVLFTAVAVYWVDLLVSWQAGGLADVQAGQAGPAGPDCRRLLEILTCTEPALCSSQQPRGAASHDLYDRRRPSAAWVVDTEVIVSPET